MRVCRYDDHCLHTTIEVGKLVTAVGPVGQVSGSGGLTPQNHLLMA